MRLEIHLLVLNCVLSLAAGDDAAWKRAARRKTAALERSWSQTDGRPRVDNQTWPIMLEWQNRRVAVTYNDPLGLFVAIGVHNISWCDHVFSVSDDLHTWSAPYSLGEECAGSYSDAQRPRNIFRDRDLSRRAVRPSWWRG